MSLQYLLDGYNILHQMNLPDNMLVEDQRQALVRFIEIQAPQGSARNHVIIYFDGSGSSVRGMLPKGIRVIFSIEKSADDKIKDYVQNTSKADQIIVVTDDREIQYFVKAHGAQVCSVKNFLSRPKASNNNSAASGKTSRSKNISKSTESRINQELENIWLKKKKKP